MEIQHGAVTWLDVRLYPHNEDDEPDPAIAELASRFRLHPVIASELEAPSARSRVEAYDHYLFLVYRFPIWDPIERVSRRGEVDFIITATHVVTVCYDRIAAWNEFIEKLHQEDVMAKTFQGTLQLTYYLIEAILAFNHRQLRHIGEKIEEISYGLFKNNERVMLEQISYLKRDISEYRIIFSPQAQLLNSLQANGKRFWGEDVDPYLNDLVGDHLKLMNQIEDYRAAILDYQSTNKQLLDHKSTEVMKRLTVMAFITFPLVPFVGLFAIHMHGMPLIDHPYGFWIIVGICLIAIAAMLSYFKGRGWL